MFVSDNKNISENSHSAKFDFGIAQFKEKKLRDIHEHYSLAWKPESENHVSGISISADWLMAQPLFPFLIQSLPPQKIFRTLKEQGLQDSLEIVEWLRGAQLQKVLDYDIWEKNTELLKNDISESSIISWIWVWLEIDKIFAAERFLELDEEVVCLILSKLFEIVPDGVGFVSDDVRENWWLTPDNRFFLNMRTQEGTHFEILKNFVDALYTHDMQTAGNLFAYAAMLVREESIEMADKWRTARLSDQGFIEKTEAISSLYSKVSAPQKLNKFKSSLSLFQNEDLYDNVIKFITSCEPSDGVKVLEQALGSDSVKLLAGGAGNTSLEQFYDDEDFIHACAEQVIRNCEKTLLKLEFSHSQGRSVKQDLLIEKVLSRFNIEKYEHLLTIKGKIAQISNMVASATFDSQEDSIVSRALLAVRGCLNIGLELCLEHYVPHGINFLSNNDVECGKACIEELGIEYLFKLGWEKILEIQKELVHDLFKNNKIKSKKLFDAFNWFSSAEGQLSSEISVVLEGLLAFVPMFSLALKVEEVKTNHVSSGFKPFENLFELKIASQFVRNAGLNF